MRNPSLAGADGPANLLASVQVAASPVARRLGTLIVLNDEIHAARFVRKTHPQNPAAFGSSPVGPIGWVVEDVPKIAVDLPRIPHLLVPRRYQSKSVALLTVALGDDGSLLRAVEGSGYAGLVVEAMGGGHVPAVMVEALASLAEKMPVVLASRTGGGETLRRTYGFPGSETDLLRRGLISAGPLDGLKARLLLMLLMLSGIERKEVAPAFERWIEAVFV
jgi:L-asparaginase